MFSFRATVTLQNGTTIVREIVNVLVIAPNCINLPNRDNTIMAFQDFLLCDEDTDMTINRLILFLMIEHPVMGVPGTGLLNDVAYLEAL